MSAPISSITKTEKHTVEETESKQNKTQKASSETEKTARVVHSSIAQVAHQQPSHFTFESPMLQGTYCDPNGEMQPSCYFDEMGNYGPAYGYFPPQEYYSPYPSPESFPSQIAIPAVAWPQVSDPFSHSISNAQQLNHFARKVEQLKHSIGFYKRQIRKLEQTVTDYVEKLTAQQIENKQEKIESKKALEDRDRRIAKLLETNISLQRKLWEYKNNQSRNEPVEKSEIRSLQELEPKWEKIHSESELKKWRDGRFVFFKSNLYSKATNVKEACHSENPNVRMGKIYYDGQWKIVPFDTSGQKINNTHIVEFPIPSLRYLHVVPMLRREIKTLSLSD